MCYLRKHVLLQDDRVDIFFLDLQKVQLYFLSTTKKIKFYLILITKKTDVFGSKVINFYLASLLLKRLSSINPLKIRVNTNYNLKACTVVSFKQDFRQFLNYEIY